MKQCVSCRVNGRVQGVWYRGSTQQQAQRLGLTGYAMNLPDGSVEVVACGDHDALALLQMWLWQGPPAARVDDVSCSSHEVGEFQEFTTR